MSSLSYLDSDFESDYLGVGCDLVLRTAGEGCIYSNISPDLHPVFVYNEVLSLRLNQTFLKTVVPLSTVSTHLSYATPVGREGVGGRGSRETSFLRAVSPNWWVRLRGVGCPGGSYMTGDVTLHVPVSLLILFQRRRVLGRGSLPSTHVLLTKFWIRLYLVNVTVMKLQDRSRSSLFETRVKTVINDPLKSV